MAILSGMCWRLERRGSEDAAGDGGVVAEAVREVRRRDGVWGETEYGRR